MDSPEYPCGNCTQPSYYPCKDRCQAWRQWYFYRQSLINQYAKKLERYWIYDLPLHRIHSTATKET